MSNPDFFAENCTQHANMLVVPKLLSLVCWNCYICFFQVVSVSRTPGHTKHFQTIFLTPTVRLCDSPGLVFPSKVDKNLQVSLCSLSWNYWQHKKYQHVWFGAVWLDLTVISYNLWTLKTQICAPPPSHISITPLHPTYFYTGHIRSI